jgi:N4-gp56 family major capsid protein
MATNTASQFSADIVSYIAEKTLPLARRQLVAYQFGDPLTLPKGRGTTYTATRYLRVPLPFAPLSEGVPPVGETMTIQQVSATAQQWGDKITITDVAEMTIYHPLFQKATELVGLQVAETLERNTFNTLNAGTQINFVNSRGARASLVAGDVLNPFEIQRAYSMLFTLGAPRFMGDEMTDTKLDADAGGAKASNNPRTMPHYTALIHPFAAADLRQNSQVQTAWAYSDINRIYNFEAGEFNGIRFCETNLVPAFTGIAAIQGTAGTAGSLATNANYRIQVVGTDSQNQYESQVYQVSNAISVTGPNGSIAVTMPSTVGFTYSVYVAISAAATMPNASLGASVLGPTSGPLQGVATQLAPGAAVVITYLKEADKSDPLNQLRVVGWKAYYGTLIENQQFFMRIESASAFNATFG